MKAKKISIYASPNRYGYRYNVNHPQIRQAYQAYMKKHQIYTIPSDWQRYDFEREVAQRLAARRGKP